MHRSVSCVVVSLAMIGCDAGDMGSDEDPDVGAAAGDDAPSSDTAAASSDDSAVDGGVVGPDTAAPPDSGPVSACDPTCTGTKLCDDSGGCVCAPGFAPTGKDCVAEVITAPATRTKVEVCARFKAANARPATLWRAGTGGECDPGTVPFEAQMAALRYLDFYRWMIGVGPVQVLPAVARAEQECAKILNYEFGHSPSPTTKCYTKDGADACGGSLIAGGFDLLTQFDGYGLEVEQNLIHRRNILAVGRAGVWAGASGGSSDMHYGGAYPALPTDPELVAHPGPGFNVRSKVPTRWFVQKGTKTIPAVDARVFVKTSGEEKTMKRYHHYTDFSSFDVSGWTPAVDVTYRVELLDDSKAVVAKFETVFVDCP